MSQTSWEADKMLDVYIYDYLMKRKLYGTAKAFQAEAKVSTDPVAIDAPGGFLFEWWSVFWDIFIARTNDRHSEAAALYIETQAMKARELKQQQQQPKQQQQQQQQQHMQMQQLLMQRQAQQQQQQNQQQQQQQQQQNQQQQNQQQQRRDGNQILNGTASGLLGNDHYMRQNSANANAIAAKLYEERSKLSLQRDPLDDAAMKQKMSDNPGQLLDPNNASMLKSAALGGQPAGQTLLGTSGGISGNLQQLQNRSPQLPVSTQDIKPEINPMMNPRAAGSEGSLIGLHGNNQPNVPSGSSQSGNNLPLKGYPLPGLDQLRPGFLQQKSMIQSSQSLNPLQFQQLMLQAQAARHNFQPSSSNDELKRVRMLFNNRNMSLGKDGQINSVGDLDPNVGSPLQVPSVPHPDAEMLMKLQQQQVQNNNQQYLQNSIPGQQPQNSNSHIQQDKMMPSGSLNVEGSMSNTFQGNDQGLKSQIARKRKQPGSSTGPANSSGTANTAGPSPSSPSTPSTHTPGDAMSMPTMPQNGVGSKSMLMYKDNLGSLNSAQNHLTDIDRFVDDGALDDNIDSFLSHEEQEPQDRVTRCGDVGKGFSFKEMKLITASTNKVECCNFSSDGKLLATGGHDKKAVLWCTESFNVKSTLEEHSQWITDVRFSPSLSRLATSSADKTVRIWDAENPGYSLRTFVGHSSTVTSLDFHPTKEDLVSSCDNNSEIRYWSIKNGCARVFKGGATQLRFQPCMGRLLAAAADNIVSILDVETQVCRHKLQGHKNQVHSVCWDPSGEFLASVSDDLVRVWTVGSGNKCEFVHELNCMGNKFNTCAFHPAFPSLLIIGCYETLELWNTRENKTMTIRAHEKLVSSLAVSTASGLVASASHDKYVKIWK